MAGLLDGKSALVTGGGRGLGRAYALALADAGAQVVVNDLGGSLEGSGSDERPADHVVAEIVAQGGTAVANHGSVSVWEDAEGMVRDCLDNFGKIDILVNNAGIVRDRMMFNMTKEEWHSLMGVHLDGSFYCGKFAGIAMRQQRSGRIINVSSIGMLGLTGSSNYAAAKAAILGLTWSWAMELNRYGVTVNALFPGGATRLSAATLAIPETVSEQRKASGEGGATRTTATAERPSGNEPERMAPLVVYLASDEASWVNGQILGLGGGINLRLYGPVTETDTAVSTDGWTVDELRRSFRDALGSSLAPVGMGATQYQWYDGVSAPSAEGS